MAGPVRFTADRGVEQWTIFPGSTDLRTEMDIFCDRDIEGEGLCQQWGRGDAQTALGEAAGLWWYHRAPALSSSSYGD